VKRLALAVLLLSVAMAFGCDKTGRTSRTAGGEVNPAAASKGVRIADLPADFPKDVPVLKGATVKVAMSQGKRMVVHLYTSSSVADATRFYNDALRASGWQIESNSSASDMSTLSAKKGRSLCGVTVTKEGGGTLVRLSISPEGS